MFDTVKKLYKLKKESDAHNKSITVFLEKEKTRKKVADAAAKAAAPKTQSEQVAGDLRKAGMTDDDLKRLGYSGR